MKKKALALLLGCCMTVTLFGCGNQAEKGSTDAKSESLSTEAGTTSTAGTNTEGAQEEIDYAFGAYEKTVKIKTAGSEKASAIYPEGDSLTNNVWIRDYKDKLNIELEYDWVSDEYSTKLNLAIASGNLPDVFTVSESQMKELMEANLIWDLSEIFDQYASDTMKELRNQNEDIFQTAIFDDALYGIPELHNGDISQINYVWIRNDWKEELNLADPETMDDVVDICLAFMENYDSYGLCFDRSLKRLLNMAPAWQAYPGMWVTGEDGSIVYGSVQEEMKDALAAWADWYQQGIINSDFAIADSAKVTERAVSGEFGVMVWPSYWGYSPGNNVVKNLGADAIFYPYEIPSATGEDVLAPITFSNSKYTVVSKKCENPEAAIKMLNYYEYMLTDAYGDGVPYDEIVSHTANNMMHVVPFRILDTNKEVDQFAAVSSAVATGDTSTLTASFHWEVYDATMDWLEEQEPDAGLGAYLQHGAGEKAAYGVASKILEEDRILKTRLWGSSPEELSNYGSTLDDLLREGFTKIIMGEESIDYFDTLVENWKTAGGDAATKAVNEMYGK